MIERKQNQHFLSHFDAGVDTDENDEKVRREQRGLESTETFIFSVSNTLRRFPRLLQFPPFPLSFIRFPRLF